MCIGVPLQVLAPEGDGLFALCSDGEANERLDMRLVGALPAGTWVLAFHGAARRVLDDNEAREIRAGLRALGGVPRRAVDEIDALFADLVDREPQLPEHLRPAPPTPDPLPSALAPQG